MYNPNTMIMFKASAIPNTGSLFGNSFTYSNGTYTLTDTTTTRDNTHNYSCNNTTGSCATVRYYYYKNDFLGVKDMR